MCVLDLMCTILDIALAETYIVIVQNEGKMQNIVFSTDSTVL